MQHKPHNPRRAHSPPRLLIYYYNISAAFHGAFYLPVSLSLFDGVPFFVLFFAPCKADLNLCMRPFKVYFQRDQRIPFLGCLRLDPVRSLFYEAGVFWFEMGSWFMILP